MRRSSVLVLLAVAALVAPGLAGAHELLDHPAPTFVPQAPASTTVNSGGEGAQWELLTSFPTGNPHTDLDFFTAGGETYVSAGTLGIGPNGGGQTILRLTQDGAAVDEEGNPNAVFVSAHPSATCISNPAAALGLQHDVEATPKGAAPLNTFNPFAVTGETQLIVDATDAEGRCHDQGDLGVNAAPQGGLEIVDVTDPANPVELALTSHIGEAHTVNIDPKRPHIAYVSTSDGVGNDVNGTPGDPGDDVRANEVEGGGLGLDGFEVVDLSSCMGFPAGTPVEDKREKCRPEVFRYRYPDVGMVLGHTNQSTLYACHELEVYPDDRLTCASGQALLMLDMSEAFDDNGTPDDYSDDRPRGEPLPCAVRASSSAGPFTTGASIVDCVTGGTEEEPVDLRVSNWLTIGAPSLEGVRHLGTAHHMGRESTGETSPAYDSSQDIDFDHEAELTHSGRFAFASDERGGGVAPPGASCSPGADNLAGNGGLHAYAVDRLDGSFPAQFDGEGAYDAAATAERAFEAYARTPEGEKAIIRVPVRTEPQASLCTAHVFQQVPDQQRIFMGWYSQGTHVIDYVEHEDGTFEFVEVAYFIPEDANQWVSHVFDWEENEDGTFTYYGVAGDFELGDAGRSTVDIYRVTLPAPTQELQGTTLDQSPRRACDQDFVPDAGFTDVTASNVHGSSIDCLAWYAVTGGTSPTSYGPAGAVTRAQMATFLARLVAEGGVDLPADAPDAFPDDEGNTHEANIDALAALGIVEGRDGAFDPAGRVTRAQMASFIARAVEAVTGSLPEAGDHFSDDDGNTHETNINALASLGVVDGRRNAEGAIEYLAGAHVTRAQMASFLTRALEVARRSGQAVAGGAAVDVVPATATPGETLPGRLRTVRSLESLELSGCGLDGPVTPSGTSFSVTIPASQPTGTCTLTVTATTTRDGEAASTQTVAHRFQLIVGG